MVLSIGSRWESQWIFRAAAAILGPLRPGGPGRTAQVTSFRNLPYATVRGQLGVANALDEYTFFET
jgi:hypothetical protein